MGAIHENNFHRTKKTPIYSPLRLAFDVSRTWAAFLWGWWKACENEIRFLFLDSLVIQNPAYNILLYSYSGLDTDNITNGTKETLSSEINNHFLRKCYKLIQWISNQEHCHIYTSFSSMYAIIAEYLCNFLTSSIGTRIVVCMHNYLKIFFNPFSLYIESRTQIK